jgi:CRP/FNR family transcriptional regulator, cyclic AMP receptor protein
VRLRRGAKAERIAKVPLFAHLSKSDVSLVASIADEIDLSAGKELTREGETGREFFVLLEGSADVMKGGREVATLVGGDFFGEIALISNVPRNATVMTTSPSRALVITAEDFWALLKDSPQIQENVLKAVADRVTATMDENIVPGTSSDLQQLLLDLDERIVAIEISEEYVKGLTTDELLVLRDAAARNGIPLRIV